MYGRGKRDEPHRRALAERGPAVVRAQHVAPCVELYLQDKWRREAGCERDPAGWRERHLRGRAHGGHAHLRAAYTGGIEMVLPQPGACCRDQAGARRSRDGTSGRQGTAIGHSACAGVKRELSKRSAVGQDTGARGVCAWMQVAKGSDYAL